MQRYINQIQQNYGHIQRYLDFIQAVYVNLYYRMIDDHQHISTCIWIVIPTINMALAIMNNTSLNFTLPFKYMVLAILFKIF